jgi:hypothetical protein
MEKINFTKIASLLVVIILTACNKEECVYENNVNAVDCVESPFAGYMVQTYASTGATTDVGIIYKTLNNFTAPSGDDWNNPSLGTNRVQSIKPAMWKVGSIGQVFGIALNATSGVYLSATDVYRFSAPSYLVTYPNAFGGGGSAGIYYTDISTLTSANITTTLVTTLNSNAWDYSLTNRIPNTGGLGNSIGNIAYDKKHNQLFVTNLEDGRIYRLDATTGNVKSVFDPFLLDIPSNGIVAAGEQLWGIGVHNDGAKTKVYFARTKTIVPFTTFDSPGTKDIWSIELTSTGEFAATPQLGQPNVYNDSASSSVLEISNVAGTQALVTDIAFSNNGKMLVAERGHPHKSTVSEYSKSGISWIPANNFYVGGSTGKDSAGGVDYGVRETSINPSSFKCDDFVWATGNYMNLIASGTGLVYGVQGISSSGNNPSPSANMRTDIFLDFDNIYSFFKGAQGDVEVFRKNCCE